MELPIQLKFFKKIELYQEYKFEKTKAASTRLQAWNIEKSILKWTKTNHHHLGSSLSNEHIKNRILVSESANGLTHATENLVRRGYAERCDNSSILITKEGLLMGELINDIEGEHNINWMYEGFFYLVWATALSGAFIVIYNAIKLLIGII